MGCIDPHIDNYNMSAKIRCNTIGASVPSYPSMCTLEEYVLNKTLSIKKTLKTPFLQGVIEGDLRFYSVSQK